MTALPPPAGDPSAASRKAPRGAAAAAGRCPRCGGVLPCCRAQGAGALREWAAGLLPRDVGTGKEVRGEIPLLACLFAVVALLTVVAAAGPPLLDRMAGDALASRAATAQRAQALVRQSAVLHRPDDHAPVDPARSTLAAQLATAGAQFLRTAKPPLAGALLHQSTRVEVAAANTSTSAGHGQLGLLYADDAPAQADYVQGHPPGRSTADGPIDVAVSVRTRDALHLALGQLLDLEPATDHYRTPARVTGFFAPPTEAAAPLWRQEPLLEGSSSGAAGWQAQAVIDASALDALQRRGAGDLTATWQNLLRPSGAAATRMATPAGLVALSRAANSYAAASGDQYCPPDESGYLAVVCEVAGHGTDALVTADDIPLLVQEFGAERNQARTLESFALAGLLAVGLATIVVTARLALHRRAAAQTLQRARGASAADLALVRLLQTAPAALLGLPAGLVAARLLAPAGTSLGSPLPAAALAAGAWLILPALTWASLRDRGGRREQAPRGSRRLTVEAGVLLLAVAGVLALRSRGSAGAASGIDLQLAAVPALLGLAAVVLLIRAYPPPLRLLARAARRGRGAVATLGLSRAAGEAPRHALALLVLVTTLSTAVFGGLVSRTVSDGRRAAAVWSAGADAAVVGAGRGGTAEPDLLHVPGVRRAVVLRGTTSRLVSGRDGASWGQVRIVGVDAAALHAAAPGSELARALLSVRHGAADPAAAAGAQGTLVLPALASSEFGTAAVGDVYASSLHNSHLSFRIVGVLDDAVRTDPALGPLIGSDAAHTSGPGGDPTAAARRPMLMLDAAAAALITRHDTDYSQVLLYGPHPDAAALHVAAARVTGPTGRLVLRSEELDATRQDGLLRGVQRVYAVSTALAVLMSLLALVMELLMTARDRGRTASRLRTLGLHTRGLAALNALELLPMALVAAAGGVALGLATPAILGPALTLRRFTGGPQAPPLHTDYLLTAALGAGLAALVAATVAAETWLSRRRGLGAVLRLGDPA